MKWHHTQNITEKGKKGTLHSHFSIILRWKRPFLTESEHLCIIRHMTNTPIPIKSGEEGFGNFINLHNNQRIFFSAPFGMGKTYFLEEFFKARKDHYTVFHLYPVKYQVHNDAEIIELIGADLFIKLMEQEEGVIKGLLRSKDNKRKFVYAARSVCGLLGSFVGVDALSAFDTIKKLIRNGKKQKGKNAMADINSNFFEDLVSEIVKKVKKNNKKESVLILDDLDRLEPKHIFKILNAFSPLQDKEDNKFGFDKVIFVGDIDNIRKIFHHLYGDRTDFEGYIDKFFSVAAYQYDIEKELLGTVKQIIAGYSHNEKRPLKQSVEEKRDIVSVLFFILMLAVQVKKINLRNLFMPQNVPLPVINAATQDQRGLRNAQVSISAKILLWLFQDNKERLLDTITTIEKGITDKTISPGSDQDIFNLKDSGAYMLWETFVVGENSPLGDPFRDEKAKKEEESRQLSLYHRHLLLYHKCFEFREKGNKLEAAQEFLKILRKYIKQEIYSEVYDESESILQHRGFGP